MIQVLVEMESEKTWSTHSLELLSDAATVAKRWNTGVTAWVLTASPAIPAVTDLAACGCRQLLHLRHERFASWSSEVIAAALENTRLPDAKLFFLPGTARGEEVAARFNAPWIPDALTLAVTRTGELEVTAVLPGGKLSRVHRHTGVVTMRPGVAEIRRETPGSIEVKEIAVDLSEVPQLTTVGQFFPADPKTVDITFSNRIVSAGRGTNGTDGVALVAKLADALHASLGASRVVVDLGRAKPERQVGQTGRTVRPDLYVACGISGASHHLAGMRDSKHIVAINTDPAAPIHEVAHLSLRGDLHQLAPLIIDRLAKRK